MKQCGQMHLKCRVFVTLLTSKSFSTLCLATAAGDFSVSRYVSAAQPFFCDKGV